MKFSTMVGNQDPPLSKWSEKLVVFWDTLQGINWKEAKVVGSEKRWTQRTYLEGIETLRLKNQGINPLNAYNKMEQWQAMLASFFQEWRQIKRQWRYDSANVS